MSSSKHTCLLLRCSTVIFFIIIHFILYLMWLIFIAFNWGLVNILLRVASNYIVCTRHKLLHLWCLDHLGVILLLVERICRVSERWTLVNLLLRLLGVAETLSAWDLLFLSSSEGIVSVQLVLAVLPSMVIFIIEIVTSWATSIVVIDMTSMTLDQLSSALHETILSCMQIDMRVTPLLRDSRLIVDILLQFLLILTKLTLVIPIESCNERRFRSIGR